PGASARVVDGDEVAPVGNLVGTELHPHGRSLDRGAPGVVLGGVVAENRHVANVASGREAARDHIGSADFGMRGERGEMRHVRHLERRAPAERRDGLVGTPVGDENDVLHPTMPPYPPAANSMKPPPYRVTSA